VVGKIHSKHKLILLISSLLLLFIIKAVSGATCNSCADCTSTIAAATPGETIIFSNNINSADDCIDLNGTDHITIDCNWTTISGDDTVWDTGIYSESGVVVNITITNCSFNDFGDDIRLENVYNTTIKNIISNSAINSIQLEDGAYNTISNITTNGSHDAIFLFYINYSTVSNISGIDTSSQHVYLRRSHHNNVSHVRSTDPGTGVFLLSAQWNTFTDVTVTTTGSETQGFEMTGYRQDDFSNNISGITVNGKDPLFYGTVYNPCPNNQTIEVNDTFSGLGFVRCTNVTVINSEFIDGIYFYQTNYSSIINVSVTGSNQGIYIDYGTNNTFINVTTSNCYNCLTLYTSLGSTIRNYYSYHSNSGLSVESDSNFTQITNVYVYNMSGNGVMLDHADNVHLSNIHINLTEDEGLQIFSRYSTKLISNITIMHTIIENSAVEGLRLEDARNVYINNLTSRYNDVGVEFDESENNTITNSWIHDNVIVGLNLNIGIDDYAIGNLIYNNHFNNTDNIASSNINNTNKFNTTQSTATNIINGSTIGGNFWTNPTQTGFSDNCTDVVAPSGICDNAYTISSATLNAVDSLPLTIPDTTPPTISIISPTSVMNISILEFLLNVTVSENVELSYNLDEVGNISICSSCTTNSTMIDLISFGSHNLTIYAKDRGNNYNSSNITFTINIDTDGDGNGDAADTDVGGCRLGGIEFICVVDIR